MANNVQQLPTPIEAYLPYPAFFFISKFCKIHSFFKGSKRIIQITQDPLNIFFSALGTSLNYTLGSFSVVRFPARAILVARRVVECVEAQHKIIRSYQKLQLSFSEYPYNFNVSDNSVFSFFKSDKLNYLICKIQLIGKRLLNFLSHLFLLSSAYISLVESFSDEPSDEAVGDFFVNSRFFLNRLKENENAIYATLQSLGLHYSISNLTNTLSSTVKVCGFVTKTFDNITAEVYYVFKFFVPPKKRMFEQSIKIKNKPKMGLDELYRLQAKHEIPISSLKDLMK